MPDIEPAALSRADSIPQLSSAAFGNSKVNGATVTLSVKTAKPATNAQRIELEPIYTSLKSAIGDRWGEYKEAIGLFFLGQLNQNELSLRIDHYIVSEPTVENLHNQLIAAIYGNITRELPDQGVAPWVSANEKPMVLSKPVSGDAAEQRLKTEVMQLPARERRRLKEIPDFDIPDSGAHAIATAMTDFHLAIQIKLPDNVPASAGGLNKTNWDLEIRKRYSQPLASETGEFPDTDAIHGRMVPICYEESLPNGCSAACAEFMAIATEQYIKEVVSAIIARTRSNVPAAIGGNGIMTRNYRKQLEREEEMLLKGKLARGVANGLLPIEAREASGRRGIGMGDLRLAIGVGACELGPMPGIVEAVMGGWPEGILEGWAETRQPKKTLREGDEEGVDEGRRNGARVNGIKNDADRDLMDEDCGWEGGGAADRFKLNSLLDEILS